MPTIFAQPEAAHVSGGLTTGMRCQVAHTTLVSARRVILIRRVMEVASVAPGPQTRRGTRDTARRWGRMPESAKECALRLFHGDIASLSHPCGIQGRVVVGS